MTEIIKQRLIGSILLLFVIASAAYFLISNASDNGGEQNDEDVLIVKQPDFKSTIEPMEVEVVEDDQETLLDPHDLEKQLTSNTNTYEEKETLKSATDPTITEPAPAPKTIPTPEKKLPTKPVKISNSEPSWFIQLGSFSVQSNAQALHDKVAKLGLQPTIEKISTPKISYRVRIGPEHNKQRVDEIVAQLSTQFDIKPQVLLQKPENKQ